MSSYPEAPMWSSILNLRLTIVVGSTYLKMLLFEFPSQLHQKLRSQVPIEAITRAVISDKTTKKFYAAEDNAVLALLSWVIYIIADRSLLPVGPHDIQTEVSNQPWTWIERTFRNSEKTFRELKLNHFSFNDFLGTFAAEKWFGKKN